MNQSETPVPTVSAAEEQTPATPAAPATDKRAKLYCALRYVIAAIPLVTALVVLLCGFGDAFRESYEYTDSVGDAWSVLMFEYGWVDNLMSMRSPVVALYVAAALFGVLGAVSLGLCRSRKTLFGSRVLVSDVLRVLGSLLPLVVCVIGLVLYARLHVGREPIFDYEGVQTGWHITSAGAGIVLTIVFGALFFAAACGCFVARFVLRKNDPGLAAAEEASDRDGADAYGARFCNGLHHIAAFVPLALGLLAVIALFCTLCTTFQEKLSALKVLIAFFVPYDPNEIDFGGYREHLVDMAGSFVMIFCAIVLLTLIYGIVCVCLWRSKKRRNSTVSAAKIALTDFLSLIGMLFPVLMIVCIYLMITVFKQDPRMPYALQYEPFTYFVFLFCAIALALTVFCVIWRIVYERCSAARAAEGETIGTDDPAPVTDGAPMEPPPARDARTKLYCAMRYVAALLPLIAAAVTLLCCFGPDIDLTRSGVIYLRGSLVGSVFTAGARGSASATALIVFAALGLCYGCVCVALLPIRKRVLGLRLTDWLAIGGAVFSLLVVLLSGIAYGQLKAAVRQSVGADTELKVAMGSGLAAALAFGCIFSVALAGCVLFRWLAAKKDPAAAEAEDAPQRTGLYRRVYPFLRNAAVWIPLVFGIATVVCFLFGDYAYFEAGGYAPMSYGFCRMLSSTVRIPLAGRYEYENVSVFSVCRGHVTALLIFALVALAYGIACVCLGRNKNVRGIGLFSLRLSDLLAAGGALFPILVLSLCFGDMKNLVAVDLTGTGWDSSYTYMGVGAQAMTAICFLTLGATIVCVALRAVLARVCPEAKLAEDRALRIARPVAPASQPVAAAPTAAESVPAVAPATEPAASVPVTDPAEPVPETPAPVESEPVAAEPASAVMPATEPAAPAEPVVSEPVPVAPVVAPAPAPQPAAPAAVSRPVAPAVSAAPAKKSHVCGNCGTAFSGKFCPECGAPLRTDKTCPACGATLPASAKFCTECGHAFAASSAGVPARTAKAQKAKMPAVSGPTVGGLTAIQRVRCCGDIKKVARRKVFLKVCAFSLLFPLLPLIAILAGSFADASKWRPERIRRDKGAFVAFTIVYALFFGGMLALTILLERDVIQFALLINEIGKSLALAGVALLWLLLLFFAAGLVLSVCTFAPIGRLSAVFAPWLNGRKAGPMPDVSELLHAGDADSEAGARVVLRGRAKILPKDLLRPIASALAVVLTALVILLHGVVRPNIFQAAVLKPLLSIGSTSAEEVVNMLGEPDDAETTFSYQWFDGKYKRWQRKVEKLEEELEKALLSGSSSDLQEIGEKIEKLQTKFAALDFKVLTINMQYSGSGSEVDRESLRVAEVILDTEWRGSAKPDTRAVTHQLKKVEVDAPNGVTIDENGVVKFGYVTVTLWYKNGSYHQYELTAADYEVTAPNRVRLQWKDSYFGTDVVAYVTARSN